MSSRIRKTTSTLLAVSIFLSYGVNLYADDESTDIEEISVIETEDVTEESGEDLILCEEPEEETVEAEPETPEDPVNIEIADSGDVVIEDEDVIDISPAANEIVINVDFVNELGEPWMLYSNSQISGMYFIKTGLIDDFSVNVKVYDVNGVLLHEGDADYTDADFNSEGQLDLFKRLNNVGYDYRTDPEYFSREGVVRAVITVTDYDGQIVAVKPSEEYHSRMLVDGTEVTDPITLDVDQGDSVNVTLYPAKGLTGNFGFYDYAGLLDDERYVHNFSFKMYEYTGSNDDISQFYWTLDDDPDTKHFAVKYNNYDWYMLVSIPLGHEVTMHNFPMSATLTSFNPGWDYDTHTNIWGTTCPDLTYLTFEGQNLTRNEIEDLGLSYDAFYDFDPGDNGGNTNWNLVMSGALKYHNWGDGFQWNIYISRRPAQILFTKEYDPNDTTVDPDETHTFRITLTDTVSGKPFADQDVVYYIYDFGGCDYGLGNTIWDMQLQRYVDLGDFQRLDDENNQLFAHTDENGVMEIDVPANCYVRLGRRAPYHLGEVRQLYNSEKSYFNGSEYCYMTGLGMLPDGIHYEIEEIGSDYSATIIGDADATMQGWNEYFPNDYNNSGSSIDSLIRYLEQETITDRWGQIIRYPHIQIPRFINTRNTGSLTVEKVVTGYDNGDTFEFTLTLTDPAAGFPTSIPYTMSDGTTGTADLTAGDPVEINGKDVPTYTYTFSLKGGESITFTGIPSGTDYKVEESATSSAGYDVTYVDAEGEVETDGSTVTVTNDMPVGSLEVEKVVTGDITSDDYDADTEYEINISFDTAGTYTVSENGGTAYEKAFTADEAVSFTLKADETVLISNIPEGVGYTVTESALSDDLTDAGYATGNITKGTGTIEDDVKTQVKVNNTYTAPEEPTPTPETTPEVTPVSSYTVVKSCDATGKNVESGDQITYSITVTNTGDTEIVGIVVRDYIPEYTHYISCDSNGERGAIDGKQHVTWFISSLGVGEEIVLKMTVEVNTCVPNGTKIRNTAYYGDTGTPDKPGTNEDLPDSSTTTNEVETTVHNTKVLSATPSTGESGSRTIVISSILLVMSAFGILISWRRWREDYEDSDL